MYRCDKKAKEKSETAAQINPLVLPHKLQHAVYEGLFFTVLSLNSLKHLQGTQGIHQKPPLLLTKETACEYLKKCVLYF